MLFDPDNHNSHKTNANPKINILMSENIRQRRLNVSLEYFDALYYHHFRPDNIRHQNIPQNDLLFFVRHFQT